MVNKKRILLGICGTLLLVLIGWRFIQIFSGGGKRPTGRGGGTSQKIVVDEVQMGPLRLDYELVGDVRSSQTVDVVAKSAGLLEDVPFLEGDAVSKGDLVAKIDNAQALAQLYKVKSDLANARFTYYQLQSQRELTDVQASSQVTIANAELRAAEAGVNKNESVYKAALAQGLTNVAQAQANLEGAKANLRQSEVDFNQSKVKYERVLGLQRQGFVSHADVQDAYADVLSKNAAVDASKAQVRAAETVVTNSREQAKREAVSTDADILTARAQKASAAATVDEAVAGTSRSKSFEQQLLAQRSLVEAAEAELRIAEIAVEDTVLKSPLEGFVSSRRIDPGTVVTIGDVLLTIQSGKEVWVVAALPQEIYNYVQKGASCKVTIDGMRGEVYSAYIHQKDSSVDPASRQFNIRVKIDDPKGAVKPGMFARVLLTLGPEGSSILIPNAALYQRDDEERSATVYKVVNGEVKVSQVLFGVSDGEKTLVREGVNVGDKVVVQTAVTLKEGQKVEATSVGETTPSPSPRASQNPGDNS